VETQTGSLFNGVVAGQREGCEMKTKEQIKREARRLAHDNFYCDNGEVWQPFENTSEEDIQEMEDDLAISYEHAMLWAVK